MSKYKIVTYRGKFAAQWYDENGKRQRRSLGTDDLGIANRKIEEIRRVSAFQNRSEAKTVSDLWEAYIDDKSELARVETMRYQWKALGPAFGHLAVDGITREHTSQYLLKRQKQGRKISTVHSELGLIRQILNWGVKHRIVKDVSYVERPSQPPPKDLWLTKDQAKQYIAACSTPHVRLFVLLALATAGRKEALLDLTWDRVDFDRSQINLHKPNGRRQKGRAVVPMTNELRAALIEARAGALSDYVIEWAGRKVGNVKKGLQTAGKTSGLPWVTAHVFRHSAAVWMAEGGVAMSAIAQFFGHSNTATTEKVYARYSPNYMQGVAEHLNLGTAEVPKQKNG